MPPPTPRVSSPSSSSANPRANPRCGRITPEIFACNARILLPEPATGLNADANYPSGDCSSDRCRNFHAGVRDFGANVTCRPYRHGRAPAVWYRPLRPHSSRPPRRSRVPASAPKLALSPIEGSSLHPHSGTCTDRGLHAFIGGVYLTPVDVHPHDPLIDRRPASANVQSPTTNRKSQWP